MRQLAGRLPLLLALLVSSSLAPVPAAACCNPATTVEAAACGSACCTDSRVCAVRTVETAAAATGIFESPRPALAELAACTVVPAGKMTPAQVAFLVKASPRPPLRDLPLLV